VVRLPLFALALVAFVSCQPQPRKGEPRGPVATAPGWGSWSSRWEGPRIPEDLEPPLALAHAVATVVDGLPAEVRQAVLSPWQAFGPALPVEGPWPVDGAPEEAVEPWRADAVDLDELLQGLTSLLGSSELAVAALFVGPDALARARKALRRRAPQTLTLAQLRPQLRRKERALLDHAEEALSRAALWGLVWPVERRYRVTSGFGQRVHPLTGRLSNHRGVDIGAPEGTEVRAAAAGVARQVRVGAVNGKWVEVDHGRGVRSMYVHLSAFAVVPGQKVAAGELLGYSGATGRVTGPHLHYQLKRHDEHVDPLALRLPPERVTRALGVAPPVQGALPGPGVFAPRGSRKKVEQVVAVEGTYEQFPSDAEVALEPLDGVGDGVTLVLTDAVFNMNTPSDLPGRLFTTVLGSAPGPRVSRMMKLVMLKDRAAFRADLERLAEVPRLQRLIVAHDKCAHGADARAALQKAASFVSR
jgi:murein DD-endopeptidase MepM/ murein hydrolase activator NlpD